MSTRARTGMPRGIPVSPPLSYRSSALPSGRLMPIEVRIGRRLLRTIPAESTEGQRLIREGRVEILAPKVRAR